VTEEKLKLKVVLFGVVAYIVFYVTLVVAVSLIKNGGASFSTVAGLSLVFTTLGYFLVGFLVGRKSVRNGVLHGVTVGGAGSVLLVAALLILASILNFHGSVSDSFPVMLLMIFQSCLLCGIGGAVGQSTLNR
jgi:MFS family permease